MVMPSPDWNTVTLKWAGTLLDGSPARGSLELSYNGGVRLDDDPTNPIAVFPSRITVPITETTILINGEPRPVGYAEVQVPASNDPDISGSGATYTLTEKLMSGNGRSNINFVADIDAPGGVIWLNKITPSNPKPSEPLTVVYYSDFVALADRVENLEINGGGGASSWSELTGKPATFPPTAHSHAISEVTGLQSALNGKQPAGSYATSTELTDGLAGKANTSHTHDISNVSGLQAALDAKSTLQLGTTAGNAKAGNWVPGYADLPAGSTISVFNNAGTWPARPTTRTDISVRWVGGTVAPPIGGTGAVSGVDFWEYEVIA